MNFVPPKAPQQREAAIGLRRLLTESRLEDEEVNEGAKDDGNENVNRGDDEDEDEDEKLH